MAVDPTGIGAMASAPAASTNGTPLVLPAGSVAVRFYLATGAGVTYTIAPLQPTAAPAAVFSLAATAPLSFDEPLAAGQQVFITGVTGTVAYRAL
jgi:hypothetical protein